MDLLSLDTGLMVWTVITFIVLAFVLKKIAWKPLLNAVESRENEIREALKKAEDARDEATRLLAEQQEKLAATQNEIQQMIKEGKQMADKMRNDIIEQARSEAEKIKDRARSDIEKERQTAISSLKKEVANLVVETTARLLKAELDKNKHQKLIDESIAGFGQKN